MTLRIRVEGRGARGELGRTRALCAFPLALLLAGHALAQKPDGFPTGRATPEGAACDLARAFIAKDAALFSKTVLPPFGGGTGRAQYAAFLAKVKQSMAAEAKKKTPSPKAPKRILEVYAGRHLTKKGPASYGYASFGFKDVQFVDVKVQLQNGLTFMNRTLVIQTPDGKWAVDPAPNMSALLSDGLNQESASTVKFKARK